MVYLEVEVPTIGNNYEFRVNENAFIGTALTEILECVCQKEQLQSGENAMGFVLVDPKTERILDVNKTFKECEIKTGHRLLLV
ncbi:MAG: hypothetical protein IIT46_04400 [Lachnospiraceae bacterium]|nr:hypothetical protein [Lachnospiraceae bacterium]